MPWTVRAEKDPDEGYTILRVAELPSVIATGEGDPDLEKDFWESLQATLECALQFADPIPLPTGMKAPWDEPAAPPTPVRNVKFEGVQGVFSPPSGGQPTGLPARVNHAVQEPVAA